MLTFRGEGFAEGPRAGRRPLVAPFPTMANHTATHLLHKALRRCSATTSARRAPRAARQAALRLHTPPGADDEERAAVERIVNERMFENLAGARLRTPIEEARKLGATMLFGEKYGDEVRVVEIPGFSRELCGGTHVRSTAEIGPFAILSEGSVGAGRADRGGHLRRGLRAPAGRARELDELRAEIERVRKEKRRRRRRADGKEIVVTGGTP